MDNHTLAALLKPYRPETRVVFVTRHPHEAFQDALPPETVLAKVRAFLKSSKEEAEEE